MQTHILNLVYDLMFDDSDYGPTVAGEAKVLIGVFRNRETAQQVCDEFNPIIALAEKEQIVFPVQPYNQRLLERFGFDLNHIDQQGANFSLRIETFDLV